MAEKRKRERSQNYGNQEISLLIELVLEHQDVIENKASDAVVWKEKNEAWNRIADCFNARNPGNIPRDSATLRGKYESLKKNLKKKMAQEKMGFYVTGGGTRVPVYMKDWEEKLLQILKLSVCGLESTFDSDDINIEPAAKSPIPESAAAEPAGTNANSVPITVLGDILNANDFLDSSFSGTIEIVPVDNDHQNENCMENEENQAPNSDNLETKWENWRPSLLRSRKSRPLQRNQANTKLKKDVLNGKYNALADERQELVQLQIEIAKKELALLHKKETYKDEVRNMKKQRLLRKMEMEEEEHKLKMDQLKRNM